MVEILEGFWWENYKVFWRDFSLASEEQTRVINKHVSWSHLVCASAFSTLGQAPLNGQQRNKILTCQSQLKVIPCKDWRIPLRITPLQANIGPHSLTSRVSSHTHVSLLFFNPVSVTSTMIGGAYLLQLLGPSSHLFGLCVPLLFHK